MDYIIFFYLGFIFGSFVPTIILIEGIYLKCEFFCCPNCQKKLSISYLIPLISFFKNSCRYCGHKISLQYLFTQIITAVIFVFIYAKYGINIPAFLIMLFATCLMIMSIIDIKHRVAPDFLQLLIAGLGILYVIYSSSFERFVNVLLIFLALFTGSYLFKYFTKKEAIGMADIILLSISNFFFNLSCMPVLLLLCGIFGALSGLFWLVIYKMRYFPFLPAISASILTTLLLPEICQINNLILSCY